MNRRISRGRQWSRQILPTVGGVAFLFGLQALNGLAQAQGTVATPVLSPLAGGSESGFRIKVTDATPEATIHYTTDGSTPGLDSPTVASGETVFISKSETLKVSAFADGYTPSEVVEADCILLKFGKGCGSFPRG